MTTKDRDEVGALKARSSAVVVSNCSPRYSAALYLMIIGWIQGLLHADKILPKPTLDSATLYIRRYGNLTSWLVLGKDVIAKGQTEIHPGHPATG